MPAAKIGKDRTSSSAAHSCPNRPLTHRNRHAVQQKQQDCRTDRAAVNQLLDVECHNEDD